ncbi:MAG: hypothetical protein J2P17_15690 [Mycobacterium sp.]|nr:hypothetical protein [Mycobacterium sp.]
MTSPATDFSLAALAESDLDVLLAQASPALQETLRCYRSGGSVSRYSGLLNSWSAFIDPE